ncbi:MAG: C45 family autoproteolytic acyltransferase/hydrolase [Acidobacteriota bacterium]|nr:C45 family autoproteolytic acyltransferase/hydrolase [Acidobacteriota bacterium]
MSLCLLTVLAPTAGRSQTSSPEGQLRIVDLEGTPYQMGRTHGTALKVEIAELVKRWKEDLTRSYKMPAEEFVRKFLAYTDFEPAIERWTPGLLDEVRGIADGAGVDFDTMFAFQLIDEIWVAGRDAAQDKCTSIAAGKRPGFPAFTSQTQDIPGFYHGYPTVLRIRDDKRSLETLVFTIPGVIALNGLNSRSVGVCVNAVTQLANSPKGLPVAFVIRGILRQKTYRDAVEFLRDIPPAAPQNYMIGGPLEAACFERSAGRMVRFTPFEGAEFTYHTNHPVVNDDFNPRFAAMLKQSGTTLAQYGAFCTRFAFLGRTLTDNSKKIDLEVLKTLYADRASGINNGGTYGCTIMILGEKPKLHISPGRPDIEPFQVLDFISSTAGPKLPPLAALGAGMSFSIRRYDGNRLLSEDKPAFAADGTALKAAAENGPARWKADLTLRPITAPKRTSVVEVICRLRLEKGAQAQTGAALRIGFDGWTTRNFVMIPAAAYNGNRFQVLPVKYPPFYDESYEGKPALPVTITDVPRLALGDGPSKMELTTGDMATPAFAAYFPALKKGLLLLFPQQTELGNSGLTLEESADRTRAELLLSAPAVRERRYGDMRLAPSGDRAPDLKEGDAITLRVQVHVFDCADIPGLYRYFFIHRKDLTGANPMENRVPFSEALRMQRDLQNDPVERWKESGGYYKNGNGDSPFGNIQIGWVGGLMQTYPLLLSGDGRSIQRSVRTLNVVWDKMVGRSGFLYGMYKDGAVYGDNFDQMEKKRSVAMIRKNADVLHFMIKQLDWMNREARGGLLRPAWEERTRTLADAFIKLWNVHGEFGQLIDVETGRIVISGSTAGAIAPAALVRASRYFDDPRYLRIAELAAEQYYRRDLANGYTTGGPGEILQCPDSESAFALLESFVLLHEATGEDRWLRYAETAAGLCSSWTVSYDYKFPEGSAMARCGAHSAGAVWASIQNKHAAPGICTSSGDFLLKLYRATGNARYLDLLKDIAHNILEFMSTARRPVGSDRDGVISERVNLSDWEGPSNVGGNISWGSVSWCEVAVMLTAVEIPSLYINPAKKLVYAFDHLEVKAAPGRGGRMEVEVRNPTSYPSTFTVFADGLRLFGARADNFAAGKLPKFPLGSGETMRLTVQPTGEINK